MFILQAFISLIALAVPLVALVKLLSSTRLDKFRNHVIVIKKHYL